MKTNQNRITLLMSLRVCLCVTLLAFASCKSCKKEVDALPPETQTGANTFGALIDGKAYIPQKGTGFGASDPVRGGYTAALPPVFYNKSNVWIRTSGGGLDLLFTFVM